MLGKRARRLPRAEARDDAAGRRRAHQQLGVDRRPRLDAARGDRDPPRRAVGARRGGRRGAAVAQHPMAKLLDDAMIAYAQNGEAIRMPNGYPARLLLPGYEGNMCIKWIRRLELVDQPNMSRDETAKYTTIETFRAV